MIIPDEIPVTQLHRYLGASPMTDSRTRFCVWSPTCDRVTVQLVDQQRSVEMARVTNEYHVAEVEGAPVGSRYYLEFRQGASVNARPDPASRWQPDGVHGPSMVVDGGRFAWSDGDWQGVAREDLIIYELHIGAFTEQGTFEAAITRLQDLVDVGVTAIELMPVADAAGRWNWGYDGVCLFAPNRNYGTPDDLRRLVDAAHQLGLAVLLDVVYNHLGPEGNYLGDSGPYLSKHHTTVWGSAPNFDDPQHGCELRRFFAANAVYWFEEFHFDGLRVDAIHCMRDNSERHVAVEISEAVTAWSQSADRPAMMIAESNVYDPEMLTPLQQGGIGFDAQWCDDFLHSVFAVVRPGEQICHRSYLPGNDLDQTLKLGYVYEGTLQNQPERQTPESRVDTRGLIYSIQHHDFIGNHPLGKRLHQLTSHETQRAAAALLLLSPGIPMLFMGEEFASDRSFQFFVDFADDPLRQSVVEGRKREYPQHDWDAGTLPIDPQAFLDSKVGSARTGNQTMHDWYQSLIVLRKQWRSAGLLSDRTLSVDNRVDQGLFVMRYDDGSTMASVVVRLTPLSGEQQDCRFPVAGDVVLDSCSNVQRDQFLPNHAKVFVASK